MALRVAQPWPHPKTGVLWFRRAVPKDLRDLVGKREELASLDTKDATEARVRYARVSAEVEARWANLRAVRTLTERDAHKLATVVHDVWLRWHSEEPTLRAEVEALFASAAPGPLDTHADLDKGHGRIEQRRVSVVRQVDWLNGGRRSPGETRLPGAACLVRVVSRTELRDRCRFDTRFFVSSAPLTAQRAAEAVRGHWAIENSLHWVLDVTFADDQSRLRKGHGAHTMAIVRHFAVNLVRAAPNPVRPEPLKPQRRPKPGTTPKPMSLKLRRKLAGCDPAYLQAVINIQPR